MYKAEQVVLLRCHRRTHAVYVYLFYATYTHSSVLFKKHSQPNLIWLEPGNSEAKLTTGVNV